MRINLLRRINPTLLCGVALIVVGMAVFIYQGITYTRVVDLEAIQAKSDTKAAPALPPILGAMVLAGGIVLVVAGTKKSWTS